MNFKQIGLLTPNDMKRIRGFTEEFSRLNQQRKSVYNRFIYLGNRITPAKTVQLQRRLNYLNREYTRLDRQQKNFSQVLIRKYKLPVRGNANVRNVMRGSLTVYRRIMSAKPLYKTPLPNNIVHKIIKSAYPV